MPTIDEAAEAAFARLSEPEAQPAEETPDDAVTAEPEGPDDDDAGTAVDEGQPEALDEDEVAGEHPEEDSPVDEDDTGAPEDDDDVIPEDAVELPDDEQFVLEVNGERVVLTGEELRSGYLRHDDYTRKRQAESAALKDAEAKAAEFAEAAEQLDQAKAWVAERQSNPPAWMAEIAASTGDPAKATAYIAQSIVHLHEAGLLTEEFASTFGLEAQDSSVTKTAQQAQLDQRLERLEQQLTSAEQEDEQQALVQQLVEEYRQQWQSIVQDEGLSFESPEAEQKLRGELVAYATEHQIDDLEKAWLRLQRDRTRSTTAAAKDKVATAKSKGTGSSPKGTKAIHRSSAPTSRAPREPARDIDDAADRAYQRLVASKAG